MQNEVDVLDPSKNIYTINSSIYSRKQSIRGQGYAFSQDEHAGRHSMANRSSINNKGGEM